MYENNPFIPPSTSKSTKQQKFFEQYLDNDLEELADELKKRYAQIENLEIEGITPVDKTDLWQQSKSVSTMKWREYNVFQFHIPGIHKLYNAVSKMTKEACDYYDINFDEQQFMIQGWFNINYAKKGKLNWHEHGGDGAPNFHGYYCVKAEPSTTHYMVFGKPFDNINKDNRAVLSETGHPHAMADWEWEGARITVAYDVLPLKTLIENGMHQEQHWIPLA